ncbi:adventurous gliding motility lipoprotein CglB [Archangium sp.]|uniref:adventurous gliding motility lipoprotein CglB n=1 Tax=Archangium sp. TaxID=1872627 RepID=UPI002D42AD14|nr:adventurous gliding motility lipoprotein CglB [Archangium sp.]HYO52676.1 adventurous gliding motility lipoprotein CglB [Archangium sp.]
MRAKLTLLRALVVGTLGGVLATGCQTYDFEPVEPLAISQTTETRRIEARERKPNLMLLVDTSGSMTDPVNKDLVVKDASNTDVYACRKNGTSTGEPCGSASSFQCDTTRCPTRWTELQGAMQDFLTGSSSIARIGLATYPDLTVDASCGATASVSINLPPADKDDEATLAANAELVKNKILAIKNSSSTPGVQTPQGGTPTSLSLQFMGSPDSGLQAADRADFVLLLTDGLPNCNANFPTPYPNEEGCFCTLPNKGCALAGAEKIGCLDKDASVGAVQALRGKEIKTIVIGFGADFNSTSESGKLGAATLNGMAEAGGFSRACKVDADCGTGDTCETAKGLCKRRFYQAGNKTELVTALRQITEKVRVDDPCLLRFDPAQRPSSQELVVVYINGERLSSGADTWSLTTDGISFAGSTCERIKSSTSADPVNIEVRAIQRR